MFHEKLLIFIFIIIAKIEANHKRDVNLCSNNLEDLKFRLSLLMFIKKCSIITFFISLVITVAIVSNNLKKYKKAKEENIKIKAVLDNIRMTISILEAKHLKR